LDIQNMATETKPVPGAADSTNGLERQGLRPSGQVHWNLVAPELMQAAARRGEGEFADMGPFVAVTSPHTGRSPNDKFVVREPSTEADIDWGKVNQPYAPAQQSWTKTSLSLSDASMRRSRASNFSGAIGRLTLPHPTFASLEASLTMNLSFGERPVCGAVLQTIGPSAVR
jgi:hypothetical protein